MRILFLDDNRFRHEAMQKNSIGFSVTYVFNADQAIKAMRDSEFDLIMLDHDLDETQENLILEGVQDGRYVVRWMVSSGRHKTTPVVVHSLNLAASEQMRDMLKSSGFEKVACLPFAWKLIGTAEDGSVIFDPSKLDKKIG